MSEWQTVQIGELCDGIYDGPHATPEKTSSGPIFLGVSNIASGRLDFSITEYLSEEDFTVWTRRVLPQENDIVFSYETRLGEAALVPAGLRCCLGRRTALMRPNLNLVDPKFLLFAYLSPQFQKIIRARTINGSTVDRIALKEFPSFPVKIPPLAEQRAIAAILSAFDDKIDLNRRMNATLEATARALFQSWFVDFDPVRAKAEGRAPDGMDAATAALFPDSFEESELGWIPRGWRVGTLGDIAGFNNWTLSKRDDLDIVQYIEISEVQRGEIGQIATYMRGEEPSRARRRLQHGDTVLSTVRPDRGAYFLAMNPSDNLLVSTGFAVFTPSHPYWSFVHAAMIRDEVFERLGALADGAAYPAVAPETIAGLPVVIPDESVVCAFHAFCAPFYEKAAQHRSESRTLAEARDALLPQLMSGDVRAGD